MGSYQWFLYEWMSIGPFIYTNQREKNTSQLSLSSSSSSPFAFGGSMVVTRLFISSDALIGTILSSVPWTITTCTPCVTNAMRKEKKNEKWGDSWELCNVNEYASVDGWWYGLIGSVDKLVDGVRWRLGALIGCCGGVHQGLSGSF